ncbi:hypothetical protein HG531_013272 [Fusarium graminearum]|nr:hypothetical protein HG531_013272 [Fusarium graminearum]
MTLLSHHNTSLNKCTRPLLQVPRNKPLHHSEDLPNHKIALLLKTRVSYQAWINEVDNHIIRAQTLSKFVHPKVRETFVLGVRGHGVHATRELGLVVVVCQDIIVVNIGKFCHQGSPRVDNRETSRLTSGSFLLECGKKKCCEQNGRQVVDLERRLMTFRTELKPCPLRSSVQNGEINSIESFALVGKVLDTLVREHVDLPDEDLGFGVLGAQFGGGRFAL